MIDVDRWVERVGGVHSGTNPNYAIASPFLPPSLPPPSLLTVAKKIQKMAIFYVNLQPCASGP